MHSVHTYIVYIHTYIHTYIPHSMHSYIQDKYLVSYVDCLLITDLVDCCREIVPRKLCLSDHIMRTSVADPSQM